MSKTQTVKGILKTFVWLTNEDWNELDHKLYRIAFGAVTFIVAGLFWFYFLRHILPTPF
ncbi:hypothetical protein HY501_02630 [Candidatus Woesearchaeota archaeon]|nr:hypothetical protein [Candidatus Woesearchaeota archaeon]